MADIDFDKLKEAIASSRTASDPNAPLQIEQEGQPVDIAAQATVPMTAAPSAPAETPPISTPNGGENGPNEATDRSDNQNVQALSTPPKSDQNPLQSLISQYQALKKPDTGYNPELSDNAIKAAIEQRNQGQANAGFIQGLNQLQAGFQRAPVGDAGYKQALAQSAQPLEDIMTRRKGVEQGLQHQNLVNELEQKKAMSNPNSSISQTYRQFAKALGNPVNDMTSATDLHQLTPLIERISATRENAAARRDAASERAETQRLMFGSKKDEKDLQHRIQTSNQTSQLLEGAKGDPAVRQAKLDKYNAAKAEALLNGYKDLNNMPPQQVKLFVAEVSKIAQGGSPTMTEMAALTPSTMSTKFADVAQKVMSEPTAANVGKFLEKYKSYLHDLKNESNKIIENKVGRILETKKPLLHAEDYNNFKEQYNKEFGIENKEMGEDDKAAIAWAKSNPTDPRSKQILNLHGM